MLNEMWSIFRVFKMSMKSTFCFIVIDGDGIRDGYNQSIGQRHIFIGRWCHNERQHGDINVIDNGRFNCGRWSDKVGGRRRRRRCFINRLWVVD